jgi:hypothetical protein
MKNYNKSCLLGGTTYIIIWVLCLYGWFANIYKLTKYDFDVPLKGEVIRGIGVVVFPIGIVMGYIDIKDS